MRDTIYDDSDDEDYDPFVHVLLLGNRFVGKTSFLFQLASGSFSIPYFPTTGVDYVTTCIDNHEGEPVDVKIWDTSGDIRTRGVIAKRLYSQASAFIIMYDVTNIDSYNDIYHWMRMIDEHSSEGSQVVIVGNKTDLRATLAATNTEDYLTKDDAREAAFCYSSKSMEVSAYTSRNVQKMMRRLVTSICDNSENYKYIRRMQQRKVTFMT